MSTTPPADARLLDSILADARVNAAFRGERHEFTSRGDAIRQALRLTLVSDAFIGQVLYRVKARLQELGVPVLPQVAHRLAIVSSQVMIGDPVSMAPGVYLLHGQVVIDGFTRIGTGVTIAPFVTIGLRAGNLQGPTIEDHVSIGTGAKVIGPITVGARAVIGANAVVVDDVAAGATVAGAPARPVGEPVTAADV